jgi:hypothetical protein
MWFRPSGYVIGALLAGTISVVGLRYGPAIVMPLVVLWIVLDVCLGTLLRQAILLVRRGGPPTLPWPARRSRLSHGLAMAVCLLVGAAFVPLLPHAVRWLAGGSLALGVVLVLASARLPLRAGSALVLGLQVSVAWVAAYLVSAPEPGTVMLLGILAGVGTGARLWHAVYQGSSTLWVARLCWGGLFAAVLLARQPLLAGLVALAAFADDLYRQQPGRQGNAGVLASLSWVAMWLFVSVAATYWGGGG